MVKKQGSNVFLLSSLIVAVSSIDPPSLVINFNLIEIAALYQIDLSLAGQLQSTSSLLGIISALAIGALSVRYDHKSILSAGLVMILLSAVACVAAPSFVLLIVSFSFIGFGSSFVSPMIYSFIGEHFTASARSKTIGLMYALRTLSYVLIIQLMGYTATQWSWRQIFLFVVVPYSLLGLALIVKAMPSYRSQGTDEERVDYLEGYRTIISNRSAVSCLAGNTLYTAAWMGIVVYTASFVRDKFQVSTGQASLVLTGLSIGVVIGSYTGGWLVNRFGRKRTTVFSAFVVSLFIICFMNMPSYKLTLAVIPALSFFGGVILTAADTLTLEQAPTARGTMMSTNSVAMKLGNALGAGVGGLMLLLFNWNVVGFSLGTAGIISAGIYQLLTEEPVKMMEEKENGVLKG
jgi:predicted MFS family arabinose efflux permease